MRRSRAPAIPTSTTSRSVEKIRADLKKLSTMTRAIRLYSSTGGVELVPPIAAEFGLKVTVGAWIDKNADRNEREIDAAINLAKRNSNVIGVVVGNETIYRGEQKVEDLIELIKRVKKSVNVPVTTGEIWNIWRDHPRTRLLRRFHRRARPALLGKFHRQAGGRSGGRIVYQLLREQFPGKRDRDRRIRLAERRLQSAQRRARPVRAGLGAAQLRHPRRSHRHGIQHRRGDRSALEVLRRRRRPLLGHPERRARAEIRLDRPDRQRELLEARDHRAAGRHPDVAADPAARPADRDAGAGAVGGRQRRRRLGRHRVRLLDRALLRVRLGLRADARPDPAGAAGADRDGADRGNRGRSPSAAARAG